MLLIFQKICLLGLHWTVGVYYRVRWILQLFASNENTYGVWKDFYPNKAFWLAMLEMVSKSIHCHSPHPQLPLQFNWPRWLLCQWTLDRRDWYGFRPKLLTASVGLLHLFPTAVAWKAWCSRWAAPSGRMLPDGVQTEMWAKKKSLVDYTPLIWESVCGYCGLALSN